MNANQTTPVNVSTEPTISQMAQALGRLARGKPKTMTVADRQRRRQWALDIAAKRRAQRDQRNSAPKDQP